MFISHVALYVDDLERARRFYKEYFDGVAGDRYHNPRTDLQSYFLTFDGGARLEIMTRPGLGTGSEQTSRGWNHVALSVGTAARVDELTQRLAEAGHPPLSGPRTTGDGYYESVVCDTEGNLVEITT